MKVLNRAENRPFVAVFRDFMPDAESQEFLEMAKGRLHRSMGRATRGKCYETRVLLILQLELFEVIYLEKLTYFPHEHHMQHSGKNGASAATSVKRTSSQAWLPELDASATASNHSAGSVAATKMSLRLKLATRLHTHRVMGAEPYQVGRFHLAECAGF